MGKKAVTKKRKRYVVMSGKVGWMAEFTSKLKANEYVIELYRALSYGAPYWVNEKE